MNKLIKLLLFLLFISWFINTVISVNINITYTNFEKSTILNTILANVLESCSDELKTVIIDDESIATIDYFLRSPSPISAITLNNSLVNNNNKSLYKINAFIAIISSTVQLQGILELFKHSQWWNIDVPIFILDRSNNFCGHALDSFEITWDMNLLTSYFLCINDQGEPIIYTYNPYAFRIPDSWNFAIKSNKYNRLNVFSRLYDKENICTGFNFDRTALLDGATIKIAARMRDTKQNQAEREKKLLGMNIYYTHIGRAIKYSLNNTFHYAANLKKLSNQDFYEFLSNGSFDLAFIDKYYPIYPEISITYPLWYYQYYIIAPRKEAFTPLEKIWKFYGISILMFTLAMIIITFIVLLFVMKKKVSFATFEVLRLVTNTSLHIKINRLSSRLFFSTIFIYFLIIQSTFQGHLSQFLTKYESRPSITSIEDLKDPKYEFISAPRELQSCLMDPVLKKKMYHTKNKDCMTDIRSNKSLACIRPYGFISDDIPYFRHLHKVNLFDTLNYYTFVTRAEWPLKNRVDIVMMYLEQSNLAEKWRNDLDRIIFFIERTIYGFRKYEPMINIKPVPLNSLKFAFQFWLIGMFCSIIYFMYELTYGNKQKVHQICKKPIKIRKFIIKINK